MDPTNHTKLHPKNSKEMEKTIVHVSPSNPRLGLYDVRCLGTSSTLNDQPRLRGRRPKAFRFSVPEPPSVLGLDDANKVFAGGLSRMLADTMCRTGLCTSTHLPVLHVLKIYGRRVVSGFPPELVCPRLPRELATAKFEAILDFAPSSDAAKLTLPSRVSRLRLAIAFKQKGDSGPSLVHYCHFEVSYRLPSMLDFVHCWGLPAFDLRVVTGLSSSRGLAAKNDDETDTFPSATQEKVHSSSFLAADTKLVEIPINSCDSYDLLFRGITRMRVSGCPDKTGINEFMCKFRIVSAKMRVDCRRLHAVLKVHLMKRGIEAETFLSVRLVTERLGRDMGVPAETIMPGDLDKPAVWAQKDVTASSTDTVELPQFPGSVMCLCVRTGDQLYHFGIKPHIITRLDSFMGDLGRKVRAYDLSTKP